MRALLIEDQALMAMLLEQELHALGYHHVDLADDDRTALASARVHCPDLIVVDDWLVRRPTIDAIRATWSDRPIPVLHFDTTLDPSWHGPHDIPLPIAFSRDQLCNAIERVRYGHGVTEGS